MQKEDCIAICLAPLLPVLLALPSLADTAHSLFLHIDNTKSAVFSRIFVHCAVKSAVVSKNFVHCALKNAAISTIFVHFVATL